MPEETLGELAERLAQRRAMHVSGNRYQPKIIWALTPKTDAEIRTAIEANGQSPFVLVNKPMMLDRRAVQMAGAPIWAQVAYLVMVEVRALNIS